MEVNSRRERKPVIDHELHIIPLFQLQFWRRELAVREDRLPHRASYLPVLPGHGYFKAYRVQPIARCSSVAYPLHKAEKWHVKYCTEEIHHSKRVLYQVDSVVQRGTARGSEQHPIYNPAEILENG